MLMGLLCIIPHGWTNAQHKKQMQYSTMFWNAEPLTFLLFHFRGVEVQWLLNLTASELQQPFYFRPYFPLPVALGLWRGECQYILPPKLIVFWIPCHLWEKGVAADSFVFILFLKWVSSLHIFFLSFSVVCVPEIIISSG